MVYTMLLAKTGEYAPPGAGIFKALILWLPAILGIAFWILLAFCIYRAAKFFSSATREQKLLRMEMGKLAEDVRLLRQDLKGNKDTDSGTQ